MNASKDESDFNTASSSFVSFFCLLGDDDILARKKTRIGSEVLCVISFCCERETRVFFSITERKKQNPEFCSFFSSRLVRSLKFSAQATERRLSITEKPTDRTPLFSFKKIKKTNMGGKDDQGNNDSGSDDDIAFADDDNDTKDEETNVESYDSDDENLEEVSFMLSIFLYRHHHRLDDERFLV